MSTETAQRGHFERPEPYSAEAADELVKDLAHDLGVAPGRIEPSCRHPLGCQAPGDGCVGPCPVTASEAEQIERDYLAAYDADRQRSARAAGLELS